MPTKLDVLVVIFTDGWNGVQVLADKVAQNAVSGAVKDAHAAHANQGSIINKVHYGLYGLVTAHSTHIDIRLEGKLAVIDVIVGLLAHICGCAYLLDLYRLCGFQTVGLDGGLDETERNGYVILVDGNNVANLGLTGQTYGITDLEHTLARCCRNIERL